MSVLYVGADVHQETTTIVVLDDQGRQLQQVTMRTSADGLAGFMEGLRGEVHLTFEESAHARWLYDLLDPVVARLVVCDPARNKLRDLENKSDKLDAYHMAKLLRGGLLKEVHHSGSTHTMLKELVKGYDHITQRLSSTKNMIKGVYRHRGLWKSGNSVYHPEERMEWLEQLDGDGIHQRMLWLYEDLDVLTERKKRARQALVAAARGHNGWKPVRSLPGFGDVRTAQSMGWVGNPWRFRGVRPFRTYIGLAVVTHSTDDYVVVDGEIRHRQHQQVRGLNRRYSRPLKSIFKSAAVTAIGTNEEVAEYFDRRSKQKGDDIARVDVARKLASIFLRVWKNQEVYEPSKASWKH